MKKHLKIMRRFSLLLLLFTLLSAVTVSENTYSVTVKQVSSSEDEDPANTVINTYTEEKDSPGIDVTCEISGSSEKTITDKDGMTPTEEDKTTDKSPDSVIRPPKFEFGESVEEFNAEVDAWIQYTLEEELLTIEDFPADIADMANVE